MTGFGVGSSNFMTIGGDAEELRAVGLLQGLEEKGLCKRPVELGSGNAHRTVHRIHGMKALYLPSLIVDIGDCLVTHSNVNAGDTQLVIALQNGGASRTKDV